MGEVGRGPSPFRRGSPARAFGPGGRPWRQSRKSVMTPKKKGAALLHGPSLGRKRPRYTTRLRGAKGPRAAMHNMADGEPPVKAKIQKNSVPSDYAAMQKYCAAYVYGAAGDGHTRRCRRLCGRSAATDPVPAGWRVALLALPAPQGQRTGRWRGSLRGRPGGQGRRAGRRSGRIASISSRRIFVYTRTTLWADALRIRNAKPAGRLQDGTACARPLPPGDTAATGVPWTRTASQRSVSPERPGP
jgi:hypothetical protein